MRREHRKHKLHYSLSRTLLEQALKLQPPVSVLCERSQLRPVGRVVGDRSVEEPVGPRQVFCGILCRPHRPELARGRREGALERRLRVNSGIDCGVDAVEELVGVGVCGGGHSVQRSFVESIFDEDCCALKTRNRFTE